MTDRIFLGMGIPPWMKEAMAAAPGRTEVEQQIHLVEHGVHIALIGTGLILSILALFFLIRFFLKLITEMRRQRYLDAGARKCLSTVAGASERSTGEMPRDIEQDTFLVIPDISGYTKFIKLNQFSVAHAQYVVSQLLDAILEASQPILRPNRVEGDSTLFSAVSTKDDPCTGITGEHVSLAVVDLLNAFYNKRSALKHDNACPCQSCMHIDDLHLKVVVHRGPLLHYRIKDFEDLSGLTIIAFFLARALGYEIVRRWFGDRLSFRLLGSQTMLMVIVFVSRLLPFVSFDLVSYAAGLTSLSAWRFAVATLAGIVPASFLLAHFGGELASADASGVGTTVAALGLITLIPIAYGFLQWRRRKI